jgi:hypothetical protein
MGRKATRQEIAAMGGQTRSVAVSGTDSNGHTIGTTVMAPASGSGVAAADGSCPRCGESVHMTGSF